MNRKKPKPFTRMNTEELARATAEFDAPMVIDTFHPLSSKERAAWQRAMRRNGRGKPGKPKQVRVTLEPRVVKAIDSLAQKRGMSRSQFIAEELRLLIRKAG